MRPARVVTSRIGRQLVRQIELAHTRKAIHLWECRRVLSAIVHRQT